MATKEGPFMRIRPELERKIFTVSRRYLESESDVQEFIGSCDQNEDNCPDTPYQFDYLSATIAAKAVIVIYDQSGSIEQEIDLAEIPRISLGYLEWTNGGQSNFFVPKKETIDILNFVTQRFVSGASCCFDLIDDQYRLAATYERNTGDDFKNKSLIGAKATIDGKKWQAEKAPDYEVDATDNKKDEVDVVFASPPYF